MGGRPTDATRVLPAQAVAAGFEIGMLLRCARTGSGRHERNATSSAEFSRAGAADRLVTLLDGFGFEVRRDAFTAGGRHRYVVHRVVCTGLDGFLLRRAWQLGRDRLCATEPAATGTRGRRRHRVALAEAAWRAALLSGRRPTGPRPVGAPHPAVGPVAVRVMDAELGRVLVRAARVLNAPVTLRTVARRQLVEVSIGPVGTGPTAAGGGPTVGFMSVSHSAPWVPA